MPSFPSREENPLFIKPLRNPNRYESDRKQSDDDCGYYETIQKLISSPQALSSSSPVVESAEIESSLEQFISATDGSILWRRVVVRSGPSCPRQIIHASYMLPQDSINNSIILPPQLSIGGKNYGDADDIDNDTNTTRCPSFLCWTTFPERPDHPLLCVLANPTLLRIWDVYPSSSQRGHHKQPQQQQQTPPIMSQEDLEGGEGHSIPLPFEACAIYAVMGGSHGLLLQRCETEEDLVALDYEIITNHNSASSNPEVVDDGFVLKPPPRPVRLRDSSASLNVSTTPTDVCGGSGGRTERLQPTPLLTSSSSLIPSLFSLNHPQGDVLPVSTSVEGDLQVGPTSDVFEKILYTGVVTWVDENCQSYRDIEQYSQPICVTYHTQLRRHAIWEIKNTPPPCQQAPLWQVSRQWRSKNGCDSHLGVLQQDLEDFELVDSVVDSSHYDAASRNDALADALGVRRSTPRSNIASVAADNASLTASRNARPGVAASSSGLPNRNKSKTSMNVSLLSPLSSRPVNDDPSVLDGNISFADNPTMSLIGIGPFGSLHPKTAITCIYVDPIPSLPAKNVFLASNSSGSGTLTLCLVCPSSQPHLSSSRNQKEMKVFSFAPIVESISHQNDSIPSSNLGRQFVVRSEGSVSCVAAQPIEASPIPKNYEPYHKKKDIAWAGMTTDILLLRYHTQDEYKLSLYRNTHHIVDCAMNQHPTIPDYCRKLSPLKIINLKNSFKNIIDVIYKNDANEIHCLRGRISLTIDSSSIEEALIQNVEASLESLGLGVAALKMRADCVRLKQSLNLSKHIGAEVVKIVVLSLFRLDMFGIDDNDIDMDVTGCAGKIPNETHWEKLLEHSNGESYSAECHELLVKNSTIDDIVDLKSKQRGIASIQFSDLSTICSLAVRHLKFSEVSFSASVFDSLHFFYEEMKLHSSTLSEGLSFVGSILCDVCYMVSCKSNISKSVPKKYLAYYLLDLENHSLNSSILKEMTDLESKECSKDSESFKFSSFETPPSFLSWIEEVLSGNPKGSPYDYINQTKLNSTCARIRSFFRIFSSFHVDDQDSRNDNKNKLQQTNNYEVVKLLIEEGYSDTEALRDELPIGISLPLLELLHQCRTEVIAEDINTDAAVWSLIGRDDLYKNMSETRQVVSSSQFPSTDTDTDNLPSFSSHLLDESGDKDKDGITQLESTSSMLFPDDNRIREVGRLLRSSKLIYLRVPRAIEVSDHDYERQKQEKLLLLSRRVLSLPVGRGAFTIGNLKPVPAEPLPLPEICLSGRIPPTNTNMALDTSECPIDMNVWPEFHNGVAAGLRLPRQLDAGESVSKITRTWIVYNRPSSKSQVDSQNNANVPDNNSQGLNHAHGGLLMALGMNGHLSTLEMTDIFDYLTHGSVTTTIGCLLGMAANMRGSCDISVSKMLCLHIPSLIPQHFSTIDVASTVQAAAVAGAGLLYEGSCHRMMTEFLLNEIGKRPSNDGNVLDREAYTLSCGLALGMVLLSKGGDGSIDTGAGLADLRIEDRLYRYIVGGLDDAEMRRRYEETDRLSIPSTSTSSNNERCSCIYEGESINVDVTAPGATLALGLMYMKSGNKTIASALDLPDTHFLLEYVRPDFLMYRVIARALILWDEVEATEEWVQAQIPKATYSAYEEMRDLAERIQLDGVEAAAGSNEKDYDRQAVRYIYTHVVAAACFSIGLRFAGTGNRDAASIIFGRVMELRELRDAMNPIASALRPSTPVLEMCLGCAAISLSMVLAGTGDLDAFRLLKILRWPCTENIYYGSHLAYGTAIGLLFLGGGTCTLGRSPKDIAALIMAFYPRYPSSTSDNQYHLQALRNLYALAVKNRELKALDVATGKSVFVPIEIHFDNNSVTPMHLKAPCLLVNTDEIPCELHVVSKQFYPQTITFDKHVGNKTFYVKRRSACIHDGERPHSHRSSFTWTDNCQGKGLLESIAPFTDDKKVLAFAKNFCDLCEFKTNGKLSRPSIAQFCTRVLQECLLRDTQHALPLYLALRNTIDMTNTGLKSRVSSAWDFRLIRTFYEKKKGSHGLLNLELVAYLIEMFEDSLVHGDVNDGLLSVLYKSKSRTLKADTDDMDLELI